MPEKMPESKNTDFSHYRQLLERVDQKFNDVYAKYPKEFQCKKGCYGCCRSGLTVTNIEAAHIRNWLELHPHAAQEIYERVQKPADRDATLCEFLDESGGCSIYPVRPIVCRSHGAPILVPAEDEEGAMDGDVCPLNFQDGGLTKLEANDWIRLDTLNTLLAAVDRAFEPEKSGERIDLKIETLTSQSKQK